MAGGTGKRGPPHVSTHRWIIPQSVHEVVLLHRETILRLASG